MHLSQSLIDLHCLLSGSCHFVFGLVFVCPGNPRETAGVVQGAGGAGVAGLGGGGEAGGRSQLKFFAETQ